MLPSTLTFCVIFFRAEFSLAGGVMATRVLLMFLAITTGKARYLQIRATCRASFGQES